MLQVAGIESEKVNEVAQFYCGLVYEIGEGVKQNYVEALKYYQLAASQNYAPAQNMLGSVYYTGEWVLSMHMAAA